MFMYFFFKILIDRVCGLSILISSVLMIVLPFPIQYIQNPAPVFIIRFLQGLVEVLKKYKCYKIFYSYQKYCIYIYIKKEEIILSIMRWSNTIGFDQICHKTLIEVHTSEFEHHNTQRMIPHNLKIIITICSITY